MIQLTILTTELKETVTQKRFFKVLSSVLIDGKSFYDLQINDSIKQYYEIRKTATGQRDDYTTGCLLDYQYFKDHCNLIAVDLMG